MFGGQSEQLEVTYTTTGVVLGDVPVKLDNDWHCGAGTRSHVTMRRTPIGDVFKRVLEPNKAMQQIIRDLSSKFPDTSSFSLVALSIDLF